jgi:hypothetical protein
MANWLTRRASFWKQAFYSKVRAAMGIFITAFTLLLIIRDGIVDPSNRDWFLLKFIPNLPWYWWLVIGTVLLLFLMLEGAYDVHNKGIAGFQKRYRARLKEYRKEFNSQLASAGVQALLAEKLPRSEELVTGAERELFTRLGGKEQSRLEAQSEETLKPDPIVVCRRVFQTPVRWNGQTFMPEEQPQEDTFYAAVAVLVNRPKAKGRVPTIRYLSAQLTFYDAESEYHGRVGHAFWLGHDYGHIALSAGGEALLVVAVGNREGGMFSANNPDAQHSRYDDEKPVELEGEHFRVQAYLSDDNVELETVFFELSRDEKGLPLLKLAEEDAA